MRFLTCTAIAVLSFTAVTACLSAQGLDEAQSETVRLGYELTLTRCKAGDCHTDSVAKGETDIILKPQGTDGATGTQVLQAHADGASFNTVIRAWNQAQGRGIEMTLTGQVDSTSASFHAHQIARCVAWNTLPVTTLTAGSYTEDGEQVTPALHLKVITP
jgi:hypothetical protein